MNIDVSEGPVEGHLRDGTPARALRLCKNEDWPLVIEVQGDNGNWWMRTRRTDGRMFDDRESVFDFLPAPRKHVVEGWEYVCRWGNGDIRRGPMFATRAEAQGYVERTNVSGLLAIVPVRIEFTEGEGLE